MIVETKSRLGVSPTWIDLQVGQTLRVLPEEGGNGVQDGRTAGHLRWVRPGGGIGIASVEGIVSSLDGTVDIVIGRRYKVEGGPIGSWRDDWYSAFVKGASLAYWVYCLAIDVLAKAERSVVHGRHCAAWRGAWAKNK